MTSQQFFDRVATHLLTQKQRSYDPRRAECRYRGPAGLQCAIGCLIPDEAYHPSFEGWNAWADTAESRAIRRAAGIRGRKQVGLATNLQQVHDLDEPTVWASCLREVAGDHGLRATVVDRLSPRGGSSPLS